MDHMIQKAISGDEGAFSSIVTCYEQQLYKISRTRLTNDEDICDAVQNTLLLAFRNIRKVKQAAYFKTWLVRILINECNAIYRQKGQADQSLSESDQADFYGSDRSFERDVENRIDFHEAMGILNFEERQAITLFYSADLSIKEISKATKANVNTVKTRLSRAKNKLRQHLERKEPPV